MQSITKHFWNRWSVEVTPDWLLRRKWHETGRNLRVGDIVLVHDKTPMKGKYLLAVVEAVSPGKDGLVRSCTVGYGIPRETKDITKYEGRRWVTITRSVQRLSLLLAVEEQERPLTVEGGNVITKASAESESGAESVVEGNADVESSLSNENISTFQSDAEEGVMSDVAMEKNLMKSSYSGGESVPVEVVEESVPVEIIEEVPVEVVEDVPADREQDAAAVEEEKGNYQDTQEE